MLFRSHEVDLERVSFKGALDAVRQYSNAIGQTPNSSANSSRRISWCQNFSAGLSCAGSSRMSSGYFIFNATTEISRFLISVGANRRTQFFSRKVSFNFATLSTVVSSERRMSLPLNRIRAKLFCLERSVTSLHTAFSAT